MPKRTLMLHKGAVTGMDPSLLKDGEMQQAVGVVYAPSDPAVRKIGGRVQFNAGAAIASSAVGTPAYVSFDGTSTDYIIVQVGTTLYQSKPSPVSFASARTGLTASGALGLNARKSETDQLFTCNGVDANWVEKNDGTTILHGLTAQTVAPATALGGAGITGTFIYWTTEYDSVNAIESAATAAAASAAVSPSNQTVTVTRPAQVNTSADKWRLYRTKTGGAFPIGWRVAEVAMGTTTFADATTDANLVLNAPFPITQITSQASGVLASVAEPQNLPPPVFRSIEFMGGSLCGVYNRHMAFSEALLYHYFPVSYVIPFKPRFGGQARCNRFVNNVMLVFFDHETFRVNYLPYAGDALFDPGVAQERISNYGTPSPLGAVVFSGWGGRQMCLVASRATAMLTDGHAFDQAVRNIDWPNTIPPANLGTVVCIDDPDSLRCIMYYNDSVTDATSWSKLHFYYDHSRVEYEFGRFPELVWTGPHKCPGPGVIGVTANVPIEYTGSRKADGFVYKENTGTSDGANLTDSSGTVPFSIKTPRVYPAGLGSGATHQRAYIHKSSAGTGAYACTLNAHNDGSGNADVSLARTIDATQAGISSQDFNAAAQSFDMTVTRNDTLAMPNINNLTLTFTDEQEEWTKTNPLTK